MSNMHNWNTLPKSYKEAIKEAILKAAQDRAGPEGWKSADECLEEIEFLPRDGFMPFSHNKGGLVYQNFTDLMGYYGGGYTPKHEGAAKEIERQISCMSEVINTHLGADASESEQHEYEIDYLSGENASIMHELQVKYEGKNDKGFHVAYVSAAVNTEGPYHRKHIDWAPNVFCEGSEGVEIKWRNLGELKRKLDKALKQVSKKVF